MFDEFGTETDLGFVPATPFSQSERTTSVATLLSQFALIKVVGPDSERFLQGQITCDVTEISHDTWVAGACCTAKGRMVANFILAKTAEGFFLRLPRAQAATLMAHLKKYIVFFKSELSLAMDLHIVGVIHIAHRENSDPSHATFNKTDEGFRLIWPDGREEFWSSELDSKTLLSGELCPELQWQEADIMNGWLWVQPESTEAWVPQYIGWQHHHGISFSKGCYTGQEIIARLQYLGKSKKNLYQVSATEVLGPIMSSVEQNGKTIGELASRCQNLGLAVVNSDAPSLTAEISGQPVTLEKVFYT